MRLATSSFFALLLIGLLAATALGQANVKQNIGGKIGGLVDERNKELEQAMNGEPRPVATAPATPPPAPVVLNTNISAGWIERKLTTGITVRLYFAHPAIATGAKPRLPGLIVIQEWWGVNEDIQERTRDFAARGYYAVAVDLYDGKVAKDPKEAAELKQRATDTGAMVRMKAGLSLLADEGRAGAVDSNRVGVIGWCMGGEQALKLAVTDPRVKAIVMFYGTPVTEPELLKNIKGPMLGIFGKEDKSIPNELVDKLDKALETANIPHAIYRYDGVGHAFASKSAKASGMYDEAKAAEAWKVTWEWLDKNVAGPTATTAPAK